MDVHLYRVQVTFSREPKLPLDPTYQAGLTPSEALRLAIQKRPSLQRKHGPVWHLGNLRPIDEDSEFFALGKTTKTTLPQWDEERKVFLETTLESSPNTRVIVDYPLELLGIVAKPRLSPTVGSIAKVLEKLLNEVGAGLGPAKFEVSPLHEEGKFIQQIRFAHAVTQLTFTVRRPNPMDTDGLINGPMQKTVEDIHGEQARTIISGKDLDRDVVERIVRATTSTGDGVSARIVQAPQGRPITIRPSDENIIFQPDDLDSDDGREAGVRGLRALYHRLRGIV